jgi:hypothetical protein
MNKTKRIVEFLGGIEWLFNVNGFEREIVLKEEDENYIGAEITFDEKYQRITITIYPQFFKETLQGQRKILLHELCHCLTMPQKLLACSLTEGDLVTLKQIKDENERATSRIENILDGLLRGRLKYAKEAYAGYITTQKTKKPVKKMLENTALDKPLSTT